MFITALVVLIIIKLRFPKGKSIHHIIYIYIYIYTLPSFRLQLVQTDVPLQEQRIYGAVCSCASFHRWPIQVYPSKGINTRAILTQTPTPTKREDCYTVWA